MRQAMPGKAITAIIRTNIPPNIIWSRPDWVSPVSPSAGAMRCWARTMALRRSEEHTSELQSLMRISYAVFCLKNKNNILRHYQHATSRLSLHHLNNSIVLHQEVDAIHLRTD